MKNETNQIGGIFGVIVLGIIGWFVWTHYIYPPTWMATFYYNPGDLTQYWQTQGLSSVEQCRNWVNGQSIRDIDGVFDYECGKNCKAIDIGLYKCDETVE